MCNFVTVRKSAAEVAANFGVADPIQFNVGEAVNSHPDSRQLPGTKVAI